MAIKKSRRNRLPNLPEEIIVQILLRVPSKSLVRFRCVCKSWLALFAEPGFTKMRGHCGLIVSTSQRGRQSDSVRLDFEDLDNCIVNLHFSQIPSRYQTLTVFGSCNGLLLCKFSYCSEDLYLCNPTTRHCKKLPPSGRWVGNFGFYGFGYDSSIDDYMAVKAHCSYSKITKTTVYRIKLYSRRTNSWKRARDFPYAGKILQDKGEFVNGSLHWLGLPLGQGSKLFTITCFDLEKKKFGEMSVPDCGNIEIRMLIVGVLKGCLCVVCSDLERLDNIWSIWMMKEYGVKESWTKLITIPPSLTERDPPWPLYITKSGELIMQVWNRGIVEYNFEDKTFKDLLVAKSFIESATFDWNAKDSFLWNPTTRQCKELPQTGPSEFTYNFYGFGYDSSKDDYKVVIGLYENIYEKEFEIQVYSRRTNSWKKIQVHPRTLFFMVSAVVDQRLRDDGGGGSAAEEEG
ncbi:F-box/kelch-repeat protein At3g23880-like [Cornus florida]|uniref:F-box/kelch-repeat protein At3g23880-like n=1 Tax=Cornus florida TaxID=4283 RepID=UPI00289CC72B|nr:F-box/kelch-repeat protein At3g23880-like [Cornus florida]